MAESLQAQIEKLRLSIDGLEAQRSALGEAIVDPALAALRRQLAELAEQAAAQEVPTKERRMVTILFIDMVGLTGMAEKLDPEEWHQVMNKLHTALGEAITTHHGTIAQYLGDGVLAFFGAKEAGEHDPENAIRAALDGQTAVTNLLAAEKVQLRAGIHTGLVVVGELGEAPHKEFTACGDAVNLAARLQTNAPPGGILISHDTYRYVRGVFDLTPRLPLTVKGKSEPLQTYLVRRAKARPFRSAARGVAGIETRTVGREAETQALQAAYLRAYEGQGVVWAQLVSDPGVGKSRLLEDLSDWMDLREETYRLLRARAFPDDCHQAFALVRRMWLDRFQVAEDAPLEQAEAKWVERFKELSGQEDCEEAAHALGLLVGLPFENSPYIKAMRDDPTQVKGRALVVSRELVQAVLRQYPVVVLLEDLQWTDAASWEYLMEVFLAGAVDDWPNGRPNGRPNGQPTGRPNGLFILGAARPEWRPPEQLSELFKSSSPDEIGSNKSGAEKWGALIDLAPLTDGATREAADFYTRALDLLPPVDRDRRWQTLLGREETHSVTGDAEPWQADITALLELAQSFDDDNYLAEANLRQALFAMRTGDESLSGRASQEAFAAARRCGNEAIEAKALSLSAVAAVNRGDKPASLEYIEKALELARHLGDESVLAFVLFRAAYCYFMLGDFAWISLQLEQIELDHRRGNRNQEASGLGNLGDGYIWMGLYKQGRSQTEQARKINEALDARRNLAYNLANLGNIYLATGDLRKARQLTEQALQKISPSRDT